MAQLHVLFGISSFRRRLPLAVIILRLGTTLTALLGGAAIDVQAQTTASYTITDLGTLGGTNSQARGINNSGQVVGSAYTSGNSASHAVLFSVSGGVVSRTDLGTLGGTNSMAYGINDVGRIVGTSDITDNNASHAVLFNVNGSAVSCTDLGTLDGSYSDAYGINDAGQIVGASETTRNSVPRAVLFSVNGGVVSRTDLGGTNSRAYGINDAGQVVGYAQTSGNNASHAVLFNVNGSTVSRTDLGTLGGDGSYAYSLNNAGQIVGESNTAGNSSYHATLFSVSGGVVSRTDLGTLGGTDSRAYGINDAGQIVGVFNPPGSKFFAVHGFIYTAATGMRNLNNLVGSNPIATDIQVSLSPGNPINNRGQIAAKGTISNGQTHALLLTPVQSPLVFIPGIAGSTLKAGNDQLWFTLFNSDIARLSLQTSPRTPEPGIEATDIVRGVEVLGFGVADIYQGMVDHFKEAGYIEFPLEGDRKRLTNSYLLDTEWDKTPTLKTPTFFSFPYDWRLAVDSHVDDLHTYIQHIRQLHGNAKVDIVSHSLGSLLVRSYITRYGSDDFNHVVNVAGPMWGAPRCVYRMLTGKFFDIGPIDWLTSDTMRDSLSSLPVAYELLPSNTYLTKGMELGAHLISEVKWDYNGDRIKDAEGNQYYGSADSAQKYWDLFADKCKNFLSPLLPQGQITPKSPKGENFRLHIENPGQDDLSIQAGACRYLHIYGQQNKLETGLGVVAREKTFISLPIRRTLREEVQGNGDGTVPVALTNYLRTLPTPQHTVRIEYGENSKVEHPSLMGNVAVLKKIDSFLKDQPVGETNPPIGKGTKRFSWSTSAGSTSDYLKLTDGIGNTNTLQPGGLAALRIPGVRIDYGRGFVDATADDSAYLKAEQSAPPASSGALRSFSALGASLSEPTMELKIVRAAADGTPLSLRRFRFAPGSHGWQAVSPGDEGSASNAEPIVSIDTDDSGAFEASEQIPVTFSSGSGPVDITAPRLDMSLSAVGDSVVVSLAAHDDMSSAPAIRYTINDGPIQNYGSPLSFTSDANAVLKAIAEDDTGNTTGLITTTMHPALSVQGNGGTIVLQWPIADAYVLEETDDLNGTWARSAAQVTQDGFSASATMPTGTSKQRFFRLRSQTVTK